MPNELSVGAAWMWAAFVAFVRAMLAAEQFLACGNKAHRVRLREAAA